MNLQVIKLRGVFDQLSQSLNSSPQKPSTNASPASASHQPLAMSADVSAQFHADLHRSVSSLSSVHGNLEGFAVPHHEMSSQPSRPGSRASNLPSEALLSEEENTPNVSQVRHGFQATRIAAAFRAESVTGGFATAKSKRRKGELAASTNTLANTRRPWGAGAGLVRGHPSQGEGRSARNRRINSPSDDDGASAHLRAGSDRGRLARALRMNHSLRTQVARARQQCIDDYIFLSRRSGL